MITHRRFMNIVICASLDFTPQIKNVAAALRASGHDVTIPRTAGMIINGEVALEDIKKEKATGTIVARTIRQDSIRSYYEKIKHADAILVLNYDKKGIVNYLGGNTLMEIGFAYVLNKKIYLMNPIPEIEYYKSEIEAVQPIILNGDLNKIIG